MKRPASPHAPDTPAGDAGASGRMARIRARDGQGYVVEYASVGEIADAVVDLIVGAK